MTRIVVLGGRTLRGRLKRSRALEYEFVEPGNPGESLAPARYAAALIPLGAKSTPKQVARARRALPGRPLGGVAVRPDERTLRRILREELKAG